MNFKKYKNMEPDAKKDESFYLIGLDIGNDSTAIAYYNANTQKPESIDLSGGYGKPSIPTAIQYVSDTKEWVTGEYAILNQGGGIVFLRLLERMGKNEYVDVGGRLVSLASVFAIFVKEVLLNVRNINPKAEIVGIVATVPAYYSENQKTEFRKVFKLAGFDKELIGFASDRECVLAKYLHEKKPMDGKVLVLDFGSRELRGGLYKLENSGSETVCTCLSFYFDDSISMQAIDGEAYKLFESFLGKSLKSVYKEQMAGFHFQHKDMLFQKNIREKPLKLYFNFIYPPVEHTLTYQMADRLIKPFERKIIAFVSDFFEKSATGQNDVSEVICVGGGFEMLWAREVLGEIFPDKVGFAKSPKLVNAAGAGILAALHSGLWGYSLKLHDTQKFEMDYGLYDGTNFLSLVDAGSFWWQKRSAALVNICEEVAGVLEFSFSARSKSGEVNDIEKIVLSGLPVRPKGVTCLKFSVGFTSNSEAVLEVIDQGFGELFPREDYFRKFEVQIH